MIADTLEIDVLAVKQEALRDIKLYRANPKICVVRIDDFAVPDNFYSRPIKVGRIYAP